MRTISRTISRTSRFKKDYKREAKGQHRATLDADLLAVASLLAADSPLPERFRDHPLTGEWIDHRDCHIKPDLVLIYRVPDEERLELVRLGSHSELSL
jgi:mRNA interferase YafQ